MASYIQGLTDIPVPIEPFQPDFAMVQKALSTLQNRYEQGFASVKNAYNSVLNAPLTNTMLKGQRDAYVKDAEQKLKNLSSVDLSLPENQSAAEQVFSPFWEDSRMLMDATLTKRYKSEIARGEFARDSTDDKIREQYNDLSMHYLYNGMEELRDTDPNSPEFAKLQPRRWVPFKNLEKYLDEQAASQKLEINWKSPSGPYLVDIKNGQRSLQPFRTWAHNMLGNNFAEQFNVMGTVETEEGVKQLMRYDPTLTKEAAVRQLATRTMEQLKQGYQDQGAEITDSLGKINAKLNRYTDRVLDPEKDQDELQELALLNNQKKGLEEQQAALAKEQQKFIDRAPQTLEDIVRSPTSYFANLNKQRVVNGWAAARASNESVDMDINPVLKEQNDVYYKRETLRLAQAEHDLKEREFQAKWVDTDGDGEPDTYMGGGSGSGSGGGGGSRGSKKGGKPETFTSGQREGYGITDVTKTGGALDVYRREQQNRFEAAHDNILASDGVAYALEAQLHFSDVEARDFVSDLRNLMADPNNYKINNQDTFDKVKAALAKESGIDIKGPLGARNALVAVAGNYLKEKLKGGGKGMDKADRTMVQKYVMGVYALQAYNATEAARKNALQKELSGPSKFDPLKKKDKDGNMDVIGVDDLEKYFTAPSYQFRDINTGERFTMTPRELAQAYADGKVNKRLSGNFMYLSIDGRKVDQEGLIVTKPAGFVHDAEYANSAWDSFEKLGAQFPRGETEDYVSSVGYKKLHDELESKVIPNLPEFQTKTGQFGVRLKFGLRPDVDNEFSYRLLSDLQNADNRMAIYDGDERADGDVSNAVLRLLGQGETTMEKYISAVHVTTTGPHGNPVVELSVAPVKDTDKTSVGIDLTALANKTIKIEMNPNGSGETLRSMRFNSGFYVFGDLLRGKEMKSDPMLEAAGFKFRVLPDDPKNPRSVTINMERTVFDDKTGQNKPLKKWRSEPISLMDQTPDDVMAKIYRALQMHMDENEKANERYEAANSGGMTGREWLKKWNGG